MLEELIAKYGEFSHTARVEDKFDVRRHEKTGAAVGCAVSLDEDKRGIYCVIWGNLFCPTEQFPEVIHAFLDFVNKNK